MTLTVGSLFSGIGGLDLGLERAGMQVIWQSEIEPYACKVLKKHWPEVVNHGDIKEINWEQVERPNVICGGYPCQPFSTAGKRRGEEDPRHLWPWVREAISRLRPDYAILENVRGHLSMGGLSVIGELASIGYDAEWRVVSAASVGANHRRDRIIIVAYPQSQYSNECDNYTRDGSRPETLSKLGDSGRAQAMAYPNNSGNGAPRCDIDRNWQAIEQGRQVISQPGSCRCCQTMANASGERCEESLRTNEGIFVSQNVRGIGARCGSLDSWWKTEPNVGRVADGIPSRLDRLRGLGNAVVPQVAEVIGRLVVEHANA